MSNLSNTTTVITNMTELSYSENINEEELLENLENLESQFEMVRSTFNRELDPEQIERLEQQETQLFEEYYKQKKALLLKIQQQRRQGQKTSFLAFFFFLLVARFIYFF
jgi:hypothetical protein